MHWKNGIIVVLALLVILETSTIYYLHNKALVAHQEVEKEIEEARAETRSAINNWSRMLDECKKKRRQELLGDPGQIVRMKEHIDWLADEAMSCRKLKQGYCGGQ